MRALPVGALLVLVSSCAHPAPVATGRTGGARAAVAAPVFDARSAVADALRGRPGSMAVVLDAHGAPLASGGNGVGVATDALRPGSTVKPLLAEIALQAQTLSADTRFDCQGEYPPIPGLHCFAAHGSLDLPGALAASCNTFFFDVARQLGYARLRAGLERYGFGRPTGLVAGEVSGTLPPDDGADAKRAALVGIGEGPLRATLLQLTMAYAELGAQLTRPDASAVEREVLDGMIRAVQSDAGTGQEARVDGLSVAGKTGTAGPGAGEREDAHNGWFVGFAPAHAPAVVVGVFRRDAIGRQTAGIAGRIFARYRAAKRTP